ncbi:hypothetical protein Tco_1144616 [Tanacetum coccineum]
MIANELVLHMVVVVEEMCRIVEQLVKAVGDTMMDCTKVDDCCSIEATDRVVAPTPGSANTIPKIANEFTIKALFDRFLIEIQAFSQHENETQTDDWLHMKEMLKNCHGHNLNKGNIIKIFYHGLNEVTQEALNAADGAFTDERSSNSNTGQIMARMDAMTMKMDAQYKEFQYRSKCNRCEGNHSTADCNDDDTHMSRRSKIHANLLTYTFCHTPSKAYYKVSL